MYGCQPHPSSWMLEVSRGILDDRFIVRVEKPKGVPKGVMANYKPNGDNVATFSARPGIQPGRYPLHRPTRE